MIFLIVLCSIHTVKAQNWSLTGNSATTAGNYFIGTTDNNDLSIKTNNIQRLKIGQGDFLFKTNKPDGDGIVIIDDSQNKSEGKDIVWINSKYSQTQNVGLLTLSTSNWQYPVFSARENGKVLLGIAWNNTNLASCSDCPNYRLFVKDGIKTEKIKVEIAAKNGWADYVFNDNYNLMDLNTLNKYIKENKHLPEVPTTKEAIENGIELKEMNILLLKKVEELTIHVIELNKKIEKHAKKIKVLESK